MAKKDRPPVEGPMVQGLSAAGPIRWEYRTVKAREAFGSYIISEEELSAIGADGWELVQFTKDLFFFKRPRSGG